MIYLLEMKNIIMTMTIRYIYHVILIIALFTIGFISGYLYGSHGKTTEAEVTTILSSTITVTWKPGLWPRREIDINDDGIPDFIMDICPYNLKSGKGEHKMIHDLTTRTLKTIIDLTNIEPKNPNVWVMGFPEIIIGRKPWDKKYVNGFGVEFPMKVKDIKPFLISFYFRFEELELLGYDFAADAWILREDVAIKKPGTGPGEGDIEIMVWLMGVNAPGNKVGEEIVPMIINGTRVNAYFEVKRVLRSGTWDIIIFLLKDPEFKCGYVVYDPSMFVKLAEKYAPIDIRDHYLIGWEIGTEWVAYRPPATQKSWAKAIWILKDFTVIPYATISEKP